MIASPRMPPTGYEGVCSRGGRTGSPGFCRVYQPTRSCTTSVGFRPSGSRLTAAMKAVQRPGSKRNAWRGFPLVGIRVSVSCVATCGHRTAGMIGVEWVLRCRDTNDRLGVMTPGQLPERFWSKTRIEDAGYKTACLMWTAYVHPSGYGRLHWQGTLRYAHRVAYEVLVGPIPEGLVLDHLCRNRACVNVTHLEVVTNRVNILRGETLMAANVAKTHCPQGHEYTPENTVQRDGGRHCAICVQDEQEKRNSRRRTDRAAEIAARTHCGNGHALADVGTFGPYRGCLECRREGGRKRQQTIGVAGA